MDNVRTHSPTVLRRHIQQTPELRLRCAQAHAFTTFGRGVPGALVLRDLLVAMPSYREMWAAVWAHHAAGDLPAAVTAACELETALSGWSGESDATIPVLIARAWLALCRRADWHGTRELFIATALRCRAAQHRPEADTVRTARNVHAVWHLLGRRARRPPLTSPAPWRTCSLPSARTTAGPMPSHGNRSPRPPRGDLAVPHPVEPA